MKLVALLLSMLILAVSSSGVPAGDSSWNWQPRYKQLVGVKEPQRQLQLETSPNSAVSRQGAAGKPVSDAQSRSSTTTGGAEGSSSSTTTATTAAGNGGVLEVRSTNGNGGASLQSLPHGSDDLVKWCKEHRLLVGICSSVDQARAADDHSEKTTRNRHTDHVDLVNWRADRLQPQTKN